jgi:hypothetical protein
MAGARAQVRRRETDGKGIRWEAVTLTLGMVLPSQYEHQCVLCREPVLIGEPVMVTAYDMLTDGMVRTHVHCGTAWCKDEMKCAFLLSDGWEMISGAQHCASCKQVMMPGQRVWRVVNPKLRQYDRTCKLCYLKRVMA